ncbi:mechanosensitive ion channel family protein [Halorhodospira halophila]|nr:mechanosensitive ion channel family protein [Halorhodospira halophila]
MQWAIGRAYNGLVKKRLDAAGIEIPFPHRTLYFGEDHQGQAPPLRLARAGATSPNHAAGATPTAPTASDRVHHDPTDD